jgi:hypothetical protein
VLTADKMQLTSRPGSAAPIKVRVREKLVDLATGEQAQFALLPAQ